MADELQEVAVKKIGVLSAAIVFAIIGIFVGIIFGIISIAVFLLFPKISNYLGSYSTLGYFSLIIFPVVFGIIGFLSGMIIILFYNLTANVSGGIKLYS